ncbi:hypothetical protein BKA57DRAFT_467033 [Linnemannia elongata]|nr:hypothetical protein BKA57DRAFT_467033 [Linnemannia elongata]
MAMMLLPLLFFLLSLSSVVGFHSSILRRSISQSFSPLSLCLSLLFTLVLLSTLTFPYWASRHSIKIKKQKNIKNRDPIQSL